MTLRTAAWHSDEVFQLAFPDEWEVVVAGPQPTRPLTIEEMMASLRAPVGQPPVRELCRGKSHPVVVVDDLSRPTPVGQVLDLLLEEFRAAGISPSNVTTVVATGTHPAPPAEYVAKKVGTEATAHCRVVVHDHRTNCKLIGKTSFSTPIYVDQAVLAGDLVVGIGGIYPNNTAGFGGGSKLALGVLGTRSISDLHYKYQPAGWANSAASDFRKDLDEIARAIGLENIISLQVNCDRAPVRMVCGDFHRYFEDEVRYAVEHFSAPAPGCADVVICNAYPNDATLLVARMKSANAFRYSAPNATRVLLASCYLGAGDHGLFPIVPPGQLERFRRTMSALGPRAGLARVARRFWKRVRRNPSSTSSGSSRPPVLLFRPGSVPKPSLPVTPATVLANSWQQVVDLVHVQQGRTRLRAILYPCAPLQVQDPAVTLLQCETLTSASAKECRHDLCPFPRP